jgi:hypothetical protein
MDTTSSYGVSFAVTKNISLHAMKYLSGLLIFSLCSCAIVADPTKSQTPRIGATSKCEIATVDFVKKLSGARVNTEIEVAGIAGYTDDKGGDSCVWLLKEPVIMLVEVEKWPDHLVGRRLQIVGKISLLSRFPPGVQARSGDVGIVVLTGVRLKDGKAL